MTERERQCEIICLLVHCSKAHKRFQIFRLQSAAISHVLVGSWLQIRSTIDGSYPALQCGMQLDLTHCPTTSSLGDISLHIGLQMNFPFVWPEALSLIFAVCLAHKHVWQNGFHQKNYIMRRFTPKNCFLSTCFHCSSLLNIWRINDTNSALDFKRGITSHLIHTQNKQNRQTIQDITSIAYKTLTVKVIQRPGTIVCG